MGAQLLLRFVDWESQLDSKGHLPGYIPVCVNKEGVETKGHMLDLTSLKNLEQICCLRHSIVLDLKPQSINLTELISTSDDGKNWLNSLQAQYEGANSMTFSLEFPDFKPLKYTQYPADAIDRMVNQHWHPPEGDLQKLPQGTYWCKILVSMKLPNGKLWSDVGYNRKVIRADNTEDEYSICDAQEEYGRQLGVLLGKLSESDIEGKSGPFEGGFPRVHYLEFVYPVTLGNIHTECAHGIQVFLSE